MILLSSLGLETSDDRDAIGYEHMNIFLEI